VVVVNGVVVVTAFEVIVTAAVFVDTAVFVVTAFEVGVTGSIVLTKFALGSLCIELIEFIGFVTVGDKSLLTLEFRLLVPLTAAADEALTFKIRAKANSKITEQIAFRLI
jgi:hypothetical protein